MAVPPEYLPKLVLYPVFGALLVLLITVAGFGGYHICCLGRNILTDDFNEHLVLPSLSTDADNRISTTDGQVHTPQDIPTVGDNTNDKPSF